jgi:hypothetical protein
MIWSPFPALEDVKGMSFVTPALQPRFPRCMDTDSSGAFTNPRKQTSHIVSFLDPLLRAGLVLAFGVATGCTSGVASSGELRILVTVTLC